VRNFNTQAAGYVGAEIRVLRALEDYAQQREPVWR
jgi:hypothetical protein